MHIHGCVLELSQAKITLLTLFITTLGITLTSHINPFSYPWLKNTLITITIDLKKGGRGEGGSDVRVGGVREGVM